MSRAGPLIPDAVHAVEDVGLAGRRTPMEAPERTVGSVVIPAHQAKGIGRGLHRLFDSLGAGIEVIVICNGRTDATAFPRVYVDADVLVSGTAIHAVLEHLSAPVRWRRGRHSPTTPRRARGSC